MGVLYVVRAEVLSSKQFDNLMCGGGIQYLHRDPASRKRRRKGSLKSETVIYGCESQGIRIQERLCWQGPVVYTKDRPALSVERAHPQKTRP
jgi:hypothetical protein